jgi:hypothetical protein
MCVYQQWHKLHILAEYSLLLQSTTNLFFVYTDSAYWENQQQKIHYSLTQKGQLFDFCLICISNTNIHGTMVHQRRDSCRRDRNVCANQLHYVSMRTTCAATPSNSHIEEDLSECTMIKISFGTLHWIFMMAIC